jgi:hypothetical protein
LLPSGFRLELAGEAILPPGTTVPGHPDLPGGGISGLVLNGAGGRLLGVSDARDPSRVVEFAMSGEGATFTVEPKDAILLRDGPGTPPMLDPEAIALAPDGDLLIATEGDGDTDPRVPPAILVYDRTGRFRRSLPVPAHFQPTPRGPLGHGTRRNEAFESLTITPDGRQLFTAAESPLAQEDAPPDATRGARTRVLEYRRGAGGDWTPRREFFYPLDPVAVGDLRPTFQINGLVELLAIGHDRLLALERSYATEGGDGPQVNRIRLYEVALRDDLSASGANGPPAILEKRLVLDLSEVRLSPALAPLDNFEGMAIGPPLADGSASLVLVSDDNFSARQVTAFLLFRIVGRP